MSPLMPPELVNPAASLSRQRWHKPLLMGLNFKTYVTTERYRKFNSALLLHPKVLLLDEPTMGLAPLVADLIFEKILELRAAGTTVLMVETSAGGSVEPYLSRYSLYASYADAKSRRSR